MKAEQCSGKYSLKLLTTHGAATSTQHTRKLCMFEGQSMQWPMLVPYDSCMTLYVVKHVCDCLCVGLYRIFAQVMTSCPMYHASLSMLAFTVESLQ